MTSKRSRKHNAKRKKSNAQSQAIAAAVYQPKDYDGKRQKIADAVFSLMKSGKAELIEIAALVAVDDSLEDSLKKLVERQKGEINIYIPLNKGMAIFLISAGVVSGILNGKAAYPIEEQLNILNDYYSKTPENHLNNNFIT